VLRSPEDDELAGALGEPEGHVLLDQRPRLDRSTDGSGATGWYSYPCPRATRDHPRHGYEYEAVAPPMLRRPVKSALNLAGRVVGSRCPACGYRTLLRRRDLIPPRLFDEWEMDGRLRRALVDREQVWCLRCGNQVRTRQMAAVIVDELNRRLGTRARSLAELVREPAMRRLAVAEVNACGLLHPILARLPTLAYSEFGGGKPGAADEDAERLSYADASFDLVLHSETLEHVPNPDAALSENRRVLRPGGQLIFTTPVIWDRPTRRRARLGPDAQVEFLLPPSYHGVGARREDHLVFHEFGGDLPDLIRAAGFADVRVVRDPANPLLNVFVAAVA